ncbi:MAG: YqzL family protein [Bacilli bacterium]
MKHLAWNTFVHSGSIECYLLYKELDIDQSIVGENDEYVEDTEEVSH